MYGENPEGMGVGDVLAENRAELGRRFQAGHLSSGSLRSKAEREKTPRSEREEGRPAEGGFS